MLSRGAEEDEEEGRRLGMGKEEEEGEEEFSSFRSVRVGGEQARVGGEHLSGQSIFDVNQSFRHRNKIR